MTWIRSKVDYSFLQRAFVYFIKQGPLPRHVAFIMDGNRRFAEEKRLKKSQGHLEGFTKLSQVLQWCRDLGIQEISVFAFSIENFNRSSEEVKFLMNLSQEKLEELLQNKQELHSEGICIRVIGNLKLLPMKFQQLAAEVMIETKNNTRSILNICMAYTSRDEIAHAIETVRLGVQEGLIQPSDITPNLLSKCLYTRLSKPLDLIVRTSGEVRLSDFLTWQAAENGTIYRFVDHYWPSFSFWDLIWAVLHYQLSVLQISPLLSLESKQSIDCDHNQLSDPINTTASDVYLNSTQSKRTQQFLDWVDSTFWQNLTSLAL